MVVIFNMLQTKSSFTFITCTLQKNGFFIDVFLSHDLLEINESITLVSGVGQKSTTLNHSATMDPPQCSTFKIECNHLYLWYV